MSRGLVISAPASGSGKTIITLALLRALRRREVAVGSLKVGPDYIDPQFHALASGGQCRDGAADGTGSTADAAAWLGWPVVLVVDVRGQAASAAAVVKGFAEYRLGNSRAANSRAIRLLLTRPRTGSG